MIHLMVSSGLCQRLVAIVCAMRYARDVQSALTIYWKAPVGRTGLKYTSDKIYLNENLNLFFQIPPNLVLKPWEGGILEELKKAGAVILLDESNILPEFMTHNLWGNPVYPDNYDDVMAQLLIIDKTKHDAKKDAIFNMLVHPYGFNGDKLETCHLYGGPLCTARNKTAFEQTLSSFAKKLKPIQAIENIIRFEKEKLFGDSKKKKIGFHFRRSDFRPRKPFSSIVKIFHDNYYETVKGGIIYVATDDLHLQDYLIANYPNIRVYHDKIKVNNDIAGIQRAIVDLYLLAECDYLVGTKGSAFTFYAWLLSRDDVSLEYHS